MWRCYKPLTVGGMCLPCHESEERLGGGVAEKLNALYPGDKATAYRPGDFCGVVRAEMANKQRRVAAAIDRRMK